MSLADKLSAMRAASAARLPADKQAIMERATEDLRRTGILDRIVPVGGRMPAFALADHGGRRVDSDDLLAGGPLVLSFFRGPGDPTAGMSWMLCKACTPTSRALAPASS